LIIPSQFLIQVIRIELHLAVLHLLIRARRLLLLYCVPRGGFLLNGGPVVVVAVGADVEVALLAVVEVGGLMAAEVALAGGLEVGEAEGVFVVAGVEGDGLALEAVALSLLAAVHAPQLDALLPLAAHAAVVPVVRPRDVDQHVVLVALEGDGPLFVGGDRPAVFHALRTEPHLALPIVAVLVVFLAASHAPELMFLRSCRLAGDNVMLVGAGVVEVDVHDLAAHAVALLAVEAVARTLLHLRAEGAGSCLVHPVHELQRLPA
jgi:hypothetical protein